MENEACSKSVSESEEHVDELESQSLEELGLESLSEVEPGLELGLKPVPVLELLSVVV